jgi:translation initiation factor IF-2
MTNTILDEAPAASQHTSGESPLKVRIFALAKDLGMDSKVLIEHASDAGVAVKNSALASISPDERDIILKHIESLKSKPAVAREAAAPLRDTLRDVGGKVRTIDARAPRQVAAGAMTATISGGSSSTGIAERGGVATAEGPEGPEPSPDDEVAISEVDTETADATEAEAAAPPTEAAETKVESRAAESDGESAASEAIRPTDYVPPTGAYRGGIREMKPRGTVPGSTPKRQKTKPKAQLPSIASAPNFVPPTRKPVDKKEQPAQKPDIPLAEALKGSQSPLRQHLRQHRNRPEDEAGPKTAKRGGRVAVLDKEETEARKVDRRRTRRMRDDEGDQRRRRTPGRRRQRTGPVELKSHAEIELPITIRSLSEATGRPANIFQKSLFERGEMVTINDVIDEETALELALEVGVDLTIKHERDIEQELEERLNVDGSAEGLEPRPPVITILGHVDHGKTSLLDKIRSANVAGGEAGGITQHIASYQVEHNGQKITFVDTPGHAAFGEMRARGAGVTDIVVLVVAADDGVMPQTVECISHARAAGVPIVVAMNKIDLPDANEQKVLQDLAQHNVLPAEWGGDVEVIRTSATTGQGIDNLLETLLLSAELNEYKADPHRDAVGVCLEAFMDENRGVIAWLIVEQGTLRIGDIVLCGQSYGRIRAIYNDRNEEVDEAPPSTPVKVTGLNVVPGAGDRFFIMSDIDDARAAAEQRHHRGRTATLALRSGGPRTLEDILSAARGGKVQDLPLIIKADTPGSLEALRGELEKLEHPEVRVQIVHEAVGGVNESDVSLASASGAIIIAFHVVPEDRAAELADREGVEVRRYRIIYEVTDQIKRSLEGLLEPEKVEVMTGRALVLQTFKISRFGVIAGCRVLNGTIERSNRVHVIRDQTVINDYNIGSLRREKDDVREVREGMECGIRLEGFNDVKEGDLFEAFRIDLVKRTLD